MLSTDDRQIIVDLLVHEAFWASNKGDCTCMGRSRRMEQAYEAGCCPHQRARQLIGADISEIAAAQEVANG